MTRYDLTTGPIFSRITRLSLPIMATGFIQMSYNLLDMFWLGRGSTGWVAAAGMASYILWIGNALALIPRIGTEIGVGHATGASDRKMLGRWILSGMTLAGGISLVYLILVFLLSPGIIGFFAIGDAQVNQWGLLYLRIVILGLPVTFMNAVFTGIFTGSGNSRTPFILNSIGLIVNIVLDPILIFWVGWGVAGAAIATVLAQGLITLLFVFRSVKDGFGLHRRYLQIQKWAMKKIAGRGIPAALQSMFFAFVSAFLSRMVGSYGAGPFAAYNVGVQVESIGWLTMMGLSSALSAFTAQNYGGKQYHRVRGGMRVGTALGIGVGTFSMVLLVVFAYPLMGIFIGDHTAALQAGATYLVITGLSQIPMSLDFTSTGVFQGMGNTLVPSAGGIAGNALRIPLAFILRSYFGLTGIFIAIASTAALKGFVLYPLLLYYLRKKGIPGHAVREKYITSWDE